MAKNLKQTRTMPDGRPVMSFFPLVDTHGIPLDMVVFQLLQAGIMPDLWDFYLEAQRCGWKESNAYSQLEHAVQDNFDHDFALGWIRTMSFMRKMMTEPVPNPLCPLDASNPDQVIDQNTGDPVAEEIAEHILAQVKLRASSKC